MRSVDTYVSSSSTANDHHARTEQHDTAIRNQSKATSISEDKTPPAVEIGEIFE